jgi:hypothetical protein
MILDREKEDFEPGITSFDEYSRWQHRVTFGINTVAPEGITVKEKDQAHLSEEDKEVIKKNIELNVTGVADEYPNVDFYYYYSPYSVAEWNKWRNSGTLYKMLEAEMYITEMIILHKNIHLFSFNNRTDITTDLNHYKDRTHYASWISSLILKWMHDGQGQLTEENYRERLKQEYEFYTTFDYAGVKAVADKHGLFVVEDCAQAVGATFEGRNVGTLGELACFSFYPGKNLYAFGEGGRVTCDNEAYFKHMTRLKNQGCDRRYYHDEIGYNYRLEGLQGAVLSVSLKILPEWTAARRQIGERYHREITNPLITMQYHPANTEPVYHLFVITVPDHDDFVAYMESKNVECHQHYPVPCHLQDAYRFLEYQVGDCPNVEYLASHCVTLPLFPEMREDEVDRVIKLCNAYPGAGQWVK